MKVVLVLGVRDQDVDEVAPAVGDGGDGVAVARVDLTGSQRHGEQPVADALVDSHGTYRR
jgi:hypothetical protein